MYFGADYYPEHWPEDRWPIDARMMREAGINVVRVAEFSWIKLECEEGRFDFSWLDRAIAVLGAEGVKVVMGTPTATPPKWLMDKHPEIYPVTNEGKRFGFGIRRHYCPNSPVYREYTRKIVEAMAEHYRDDPQVVAWQIDNEFGDQCYCDQCLKDFRLWLRDKYGTIDRLNDEWGTNFWSQSYRSWEEVVSPRGYRESQSHLLHNPGLSLDYFRFASDSYVRYQKFQADIIRTRSKAPITHNFMVHFGELDYYDMARDLDFISLDNYPLLAWRKSHFTRSSMALDHMRCLKGKNFWMMEQQSGPCGWNTIGDTPEPGQIRLWTYQAVARGAEAVVYFRWRASTSGREQYWYGILDHDGVARRRYREIKATGEELNRLGALVTDARISSEVALIKSYDNIWSHRVSPHNPKFDYHDHLLAYYGAIVANNLNVDVTGIRADLSPYKVVFMPAFDLMTGEIRGKCEAYVRAGGVLVIGFRSGTRTWNNRMSTLTLPGEFREMAGIELAEFDSIGNFGRQVAVAGDFGEGTASIWCDVIEPKGARTLAKYQSAFYAGEAAVTVNAFGEGKVYYVGCDLDGPALARLVSAIAKDAVERTILEEAISGVELVRRESGGKPHWMALNHNPQAVTLRLAGKFSDILSGKDADGTLELEPYGVAVLTRG